jgi:hypothetical protein
MKRLLTLAVAVAAVASTLTAQAAVLDVKFSGTVQSHIGTSFADNAPISGEFFLNSSTGKYLSFNIGGYSVAPGFESKADISPDQYSALYTAQVSPVTQGGINSTFSLDLEGVNKWTSFNDAVGLLTDTSQIPSNLNIKPNNTPYDSTFSNFGFYTGNADGTNIKQLTASLNSIAVSTVPEPENFELMMVGWLVIGIRLARRNRC